MNDQQIADRISCLEAALRTSLESNFILHDLVLAIGAPDDEFSDDWEQDMERATKKLLEAKYILDNP